MGPLYTVKNQILVNPRTKRILAVSKTVEGKRHDKRLFEEDPLTNLLPPNTQVMGDSAYQGTDELHPWLSVVVPKKKPPGGELTEMEKQNNTSISKIRVRVEHPIAYLKHFNILSHKFRNKLKHANQPIHTLAAMYNFSRNYPP